jgi:hypothetical protein
MAKDWRVVIDDTGGEFSGWPSVCSEEEDRAVLHRAGFIQRHWGVHHGSGPTLKEALEIAQVVADYMNNKDTSHG